MRRLGILALAVAAACALPLAGCLDIRDKDGLINTQQPIEAGKDAEDESGTEEHPTDDGVGPSSSMQQQIEDADEEAKGGDAASTSEPSARIPTATATPSCSSPCGTTPDQT